MDRSDFEHVFHNSSKLFGSASDKNDQNEANDSGGMSEIFPMQKQYVNNQFQNSSIMEDSGNENLYPTPNDYIITDEIEQVPTTEVDIFMTNVYKFFRARGFRNILITQIINLLFVLFLVSFVIFLLVCVDIRGLLSIHDPSKFYSLSDYIVWSNLGHMHWYVSKTKTRLALGVTLPTPEYTLKIFH